MKAVSALQQHGPAVCLDFLARGFVDRDLAALIKDVGLRGVTSNPSIFENAIDGSDEYDGSVRPSSTSATDRPANCTRSLRSRICATPPMFWLRFTRRPTGRTVSSASRSPPAWRTKPRPPSRRRFLHSTGQACKGGPNSGVFLQITADGEDLAIPGQAASFGAIKAAQARGDFEALAQRGRRALQVHLECRPDQGLDCLDAAVGRVPAGERGR